MASYQKRPTKDGKIHWRAVLRIRGYPAQIATFPNKTEAKRWAEGLEADIRRGKYIPPNSQKNHTVKEMIDRYIDRELPKDHHQYATKIGHLNWWKQELGDYALNRVTPSILADCRDRLLKERIQKKPRSPATVNRYMSTLSTVFSLACREWEWISENPTFKVKKLEEPIGRVRWLNDDERERLLEVCKKSRSPQLYPIVLLALSTGMRLGEILNLTWADIDLERRTAILHKTKNKRRRSVPIVSHALEALKKYKSTQSMDTLFVFPATCGSKPINIRSSWESALKEAGIENFRFHDLRHTAASYLAMNGASESEAQAILGHRSSMMTKRYTHFSESHTSAVVENMTEKMLG